MDFVKVNSVFPQNKIQTSLSRIADAEIISNGQNEPDINLNGNKIAVLECVVL